LARPHLVGHSLGGAVVSAVGAVAPVASVVDVDQSLRLGGFKDGLTPVEGMLRDPETFPAVIDGLFAELAGPLIAPEAMQAVDDGRRPDQTVVLGVWDLIFSRSAEEIDGVVEQALAGYAGKGIPYLSLFGIDPGPDYADWLRSHIDGAEVELWADHGHYPHLVDPDRFVERLQRFWSTVD
jgi:pimeloyl-ACP methyl ester carboxylesterase